MKSIEDLKPRGLERVRGLPNRRASYQDVESASNERYNGFVVRSMLKKCSRRGREIEGDCE